MPTVVHYAAFQEAFSFYNESLFDASLPDCLIVMTRKPRSHGYLAPCRWARQDNGEVLHELGLNPVDFAVRSTEEVLSTLVHEMCHAWQQSYGEKVPRKGYHNKEWAAQMESVGLIPSDTGLPGGKQTGQSMTHFIDESGEFLRQTAVILDVGWTIPHIDIPEEKEKRKNNRPKYTCPQCSIQAWAKSGLLLGCVNCRLSLAEEIPDESEEDQEKE